LYYIPEKLLSILINNIGYIQHCPT
jgi:hypothetical protein